MGYFEEYILQNDPNHKKLMMMSKIDCQEEEFEEIDIHPRGMFETPPNREILKDRELLSTLKNLNDCGVIENFEKSMGLLAHLVSLKLSQISS